MSLFQKTIKRTFDILFSVSGLFLLFIPLLFIYCLTKITSHGPAFFFQKRIGRFGKIFTAIKFRTMFENSEDEGSVTTATDSRITPFGKMLRKYKLDEIPQLFNVLNGNMSFVGPRPDVPGYADKLEENDRKILELRPGITGPASIYFRNEEELLAGVENPIEYNDTVIWPKKIRINLHYLDTWSFWKDIGYILITVLPVLDKFFKLIGE